MTLIYLGGAWILGILFGARFAPFWGIVLSGLVLSLALGLLGHRRRALLLAGVCGLALFGGILRFEPRDTFTRLRLSVTEIEVDGERRKVSGRVLLRLARFPSYSYGDKLKVVGELKRPWSQEESFEGRHYYRDRFARQGIFSAMDYPRVE
ncbi:MAG: hypothetical protein ACE5IA_03795, partial [Dehalococcoidia bacterium]